MPSKHRRIRCRQCRRLFTQTMTRQVQCLDCRAGEPNPIPSDPATDEALTHCGTGPLTAEDRELIDRRIEVGMAIMRARHDAAVGDGHDGAERYEDLMRVPPLVVAPDVHFEDV